MDNRLPPLPAAVSIRPLREGELNDADRIFRMAFGTFLGLPEPIAFMQGAELVRARWRTDPEAFLAAELDGVLAGSNCATRWGSVGVVGPLTIRPELWDRGIGQKLIEAAMEMFRGWRTRDVGLFTFAHSPKHIALYQKFGFWPGSLTAVMRKRVEPMPHDVQAIRLSRLTEDARRSCIEACFELSDAIHPGLDLRNEIRSVLAQETGDVLLLWEGSRLDGFAVCHCGPGSEAESGTCYVKFGLCRGSLQAAASFAKLLGACQNFAATNSVPWLIAGANAARHRAYRAMLASGFQPHILGLAMHRANEPGYNREDVFLIDDWR